MCGIIGYCGPRDGVDIVLRGLKLLEYRGYDSWGIAGIDSGNLKVIKRIGKIGNVQRGDIPLGIAHLAIGHTRWATHGGVTECNAHPHLSASGRFAVVHNGIIENFEELKEELTLQGYRFVSETDTEIIGHLLERELKSHPHLSDAFLSMLRLIEGNFGIVILDRLEKKLLGARNGSPLLIGMGKGEYFFGSDIPAFLDSTREVVYLNDGECAIIDGSLGMSILSYANGAQVKREAEHISWNHEEAQKGNYPHFMIKEIHEQKESIHRAIEQDARLIEKITGMIRDAFGVFFVGAGTSYHACVSASYIFASIAKKHVNVVSASEFRNYKDFLTKKTLMVCVSQSGETADLLDAVKTARSCGVTVVSIVNVMGSSLMRQSDATIMMNCGPEICVLSTKSYTSQLAILHLLAYSLAGKKEEGASLLLAAADSVPSILNENEPIAKKLAHQIRTTHDLFLIGRDLAYPSALEGALKIKEVSYIHAEGFAGGDLKHGSIALISDGVPVIALITEQTRHLIMSNAMEVKARGAYLIGVGAHPDRLFDTFFKVPALSSADPLAMILPVQLLAYYLAVERDCDPDKPRNLAKSVTVK